MSKLRYGRLADPLDLESPITYEYADLDRHPSAIILPAFVPASTDRKGWAVNALAFVMLPGWEEKHNGLGAGAVSVQSGKFQSIARMLAKIGHAAAVAQFGVDGFDPYLSDFILGKCTERGGCVGTCSHEAAKISQPNELRLLIVDGEIRAAIRLFANLSPLVYEVIVGRLRIDLTPPPSSSPRIPPRRPRGRMG